MCTPYICIKTSFCAVVETRDKCYLCPVILIVSPIAEKGHWAGCAPVWNTLSQWLHLENIVFFACSPLKYETAARERQRAREREQQWKRHFSPPKNESACRTMQVHIFYAKAVNNIEGCWNSPFWWHEKEFLMAQTSTPALNLCNI